MDLYSGLKQPTSFCHLLRSRLTERACRIPAASREASALSLLVLRKTHQSVSNMQNKDHIELTMHPIHKYSYT